MEAYCHRRDFLFCEMCGTMLTLNSTKYATCSFCKFKQSVKEIAGREISYTIHAEDIRMEFNFWPCTDHPMDHGLFFFFIHSIEKRLAYLHLMIMKERKIRKQYAQCKNCPKVGLQYEARQMRSADEGQTIFYTCMDCGHTRTENS